MDAGTEFVLVRKTFAKNLKPYLPYSSIHGSFIERFDQSIKNHVYRWMDTNKTERYIDSLESLLEGYTNSNHSSIAISSNVACNNRSTHSEIKEKLLKYYDTFTKT